ncbi:helix-turn-helix domain-containing protein [Streptomyces sp. MMS20-AI2-20]|uniref:helix-turn-helix domain-containing protein n=1 Tax=Streptomyces sp. MMS20-AI2-20 TaxID=2925835 RepID=UPI001F606EA9|nr:helix-turn-helix domain-containing protein [Streptomyces sp. MMS20-AI2-20]MCI4146665.1 helix-turn-helix domain-containing protein [Streptomyces sp. MMS20-AI2-20]
MEVSRRLGASPDTVRTWRRRFIERGLDGLSDEPRPGVPRKITDALSYATSEHGSPTGTRQPTTVRLDKTADEILDKVAAYCRRISDSGH